ncbi:MAG: transporter substrate-binding domain-containing protein [Desulfobacterales bacterium]|nr:MAG: transporter substrate-binding domain-containing protein [Desulfobacterales bacterium]
MPIKKIFVLTILAAFLTNSAMAQSKSRLHKILEAGVLRVGTTGDWNPMTLRDPASNSYKGFDIDVMDELAKDMGVKLEFVPTEWKTLINGIVADKYDMSTSASVTPQRIRTVGFTKSYYQVSTVPLTLKSNLGQFKDWEDINQPSVIVAVTLGTSQEQQVKQFFPNAKIRSVEAPARDFQEVLAGRAQISVTSNLEASLLIQSHPQLAVVPISESRTPADLAFIVAQDDQVWLNFLNHWITIKQNRGFFDRLKAKWMPTN